MGRIIQGKTVARRSDLDFISGGVVPGGDVPFVSEHHCLAMCFRQVGTFSSPQECQNTQNMEMRKKLKHVSFDTPEGSQKGNASSGPVY